MEAEREAVNLGKSMIVPSVQELAKQPLDKIPPRYSRPFWDPPILSAATSQLSVPVIDLQRLNTGDSMDSELHKLHSACTDWGFFQPNTSLQCYCPALGPLLLFLHLGSLNHETDNKQVVHHGVGDSLLDKFRTEIENFFKLPYEEKQKLWQQPDNHEGFGQLFVVSEEQKLDWSDMFYITTLPLKLRKTELFEKLPPELRDTLEAYCMGVKKLAMVILGHMARALKLDSEEMRDLFGDGVQSIRINYYPPCPQPDMAIGFAPHSDADALTILFQLNETEGLQLRKDGKWVPVKPLPNAFIVNIGDIMEIVSNGAYRSIEHRATVHSSKERLSVATFHSSNLDSELGPARSILDPQNPPVFQRVPIEKYFKDFFARKLNGKSYLDFMRIGNGEEEFS